MVQVEDKLAEFQQRARELIRAGATGQELRDLGYEYDLDLGAASIDLATRAPVGFVEQAEQTRVAEKLPFVGGAFEGGRWYDVLEAAGAMKEGVETREQRDLVYTLLEEGRRGKTIGGQFLAVLSEMPAFITEFAVTGGLYSAGKKALGVGVQNAVKTGLAKYAGAAVNFTTRSLAQTAMMPARVYAESLRQDVSTAFEGVEIGPDEAGRLGVTFTTSIPEFKGAVERYLDPEAFFRTWIEVASESTGPAIAKLNPLSRYNLLQTAMAKRWLRANPGRTFEDLLEASGKRAATLAERTGWDGILEELGEEVVADVARNLIFGDELSAPSLQEFLGTVAAFGVRGTVQFGASIASGAPAPAAPTPPTSLREAELPGPPTPTPEEQAAAPGGTGVEAGPGVEPGVAAPSGARAAEGAVAPPEAPAPVRAAPEAIQEDLESISRANQTPVRRADISGTPEDVAQAEETVQTARRWGSEVVFFEPEEEGAAVKAPGYYREGRLYLSATAPAGARRRALFSHEAAHLLRERRGEEWEDLYRVIQKADPEGLQLARVRRASLGGLAVESDLAREEGLSYYVEGLGGYLELLATDESRVVELAKSNPSLFQEVMDVIIRALRAVGIGRGLQTSVERAGAEVAASVEQTEVSERIDPRRASQIALRVREALESMSGSEQQRSEAIGKLAAAYHGSAAEFEEFSDEFIGTGEGAQAFGYGHYFAGRREVAEWYRDQEAPGRGTSPRDIAARKVEAFKGNEQAAIRELADMAGRNFQAQGDSDFQQVVRDAIQSIRDGTYKGRVYKVELAPAEDEYLLWDKPLSEQSEKVKAAIESLPEPEYDPTMEGDALRALDARRSRPDSSTGEDLYIALTDVYSKKRASQALQAAGIRGIKYLEGASRGKGEGSYNYVIFDPRDARIEERFAVEERGRRPVPQDISRWDDNGGLTDEPTEWTFASDVGTYKISVDRENIGIAGGGVLLQYPDGEFEAPSGGGSVEQLVEELAETAALDYRDSAGRLAVEEGAEYEVQAAASRARAEGEATQVGSRDIRRQIPSVDPGARALMRGLDEYRYREGRPARVNASELTQTYREAIAQKGYDGLQKELEAKMDAGELLEAWEQVAMGRLVERALMNGLAGAKGGVRAAMDLAEKWRDNRSRVAQALGTVRDPLYNNSAREQLVDLMVRPPRQLEQQIDRTKKKLAKAKGGRIAQLRGQLAKLLDRAARKVEKARFALEEAGFVPELITEEYYEDPVTRGRITRIVEAAKSDGWDWYREFVLSAMLSAPTTHKANIVGNAAFKLYEQDLKRLGQAFVNLVVQDPDSPTFAEMGAYYRSWGGAMLNAARNFGKALASDSPVFEADLARKGAPVGEWGMKVDSLKGPAIPGMAGRALRLPSLTMLTAADEYFKTLVATTEASALAYRQAKKEGLTDDAMADRMRELLEDPTSSDVWKQGLDLSLKTTFQDRPEFKEGGKGQRRSLIQILMDARNWADNQPWLGNFPAGFSVLPFISTPTRIFQRGLEPIFFPVVGMARLLKGRYFGDKTQLVQDSSNMLISMGVWWAILSMVLDEDDEEPLITGARPKDSAEAALQYRTVPPYSVKVPGVGYRDYRRVEPAAVTMATLVDLARSVKGALRRDEPAEAVGDAAVTLFQSVMDQMKDKTFLRTFGELYDVLIESDRNERKGARLAQDFVVKHVPNLVRGPLRQGDPYLRVNRVRPYEDVSSWGAAARDLPYKVLPIEQNRPPIRYDVWGREIKRYDPEEGAISHMLVDLITPVPKANVVDRVEDVDKLLARFNRRVKQGLIEGDVWLPRPPNYWYDRTVDGQKERIYWTDDEYSFLTRETGIRALERLRGTSLDFENPSQDDVDKINKALSVARKQVRIELIRRRRQEELAAAK